MKRRKIVEDFNTAGPQRSMEIIPAGTIADVILRVRPGGAGADPMLKPSQDGGCLMVDLECTIVGGKYDKRKVWDLCVVSGTTEGHSQARDISFGKFRAILESARNIRPDDQSEAAVKARRISSWADLNGLGIVAVIGVEKAKTLPPSQRYPMGKEVPAKNTLAEIITPDKKDWHPVDQIPGFDDHGAGNGGAAAAGAAPPAPDTVPRIMRPDWAQRKPDTGTADGAARP
jgi:hypothetical protein